MYKIVILVALISTSTAAQAKIIDVTIEQQIHNVNVNVNVNVVEAPYKPFDGDVRLSLGNDFDLFHRLPIANNTLIAYFAPGNTADVLLYESNENHGKLPAILTATLVERTQQIVTQEDPKTCFHCIREICAKGIAEKVTLEFPAKNPSQKTVVFEKGLQGFDGQFQEVPMENCAN